LIVPSHAITAARRCERRLGQGRFPNSSGLPQQAQPDAQDHDRSRDHRAADCDLELLAGRSVSRCIRAMPPNIQRDP
jgi:hypothetical protein